MMKGPLSKTVRVGVLVSVALAILMAGTFLIGRERRFWETKYEYEIRFQRANGLREGAAVSLSGVDVGSVDDVSFPDEPDAGYIAVWISVTRNAASRIRASTVARILTQGLLGDKYVDLSPGSAQAPELPPGSIIPSEDPIDYEKLLGRGGDIIANIVEASNSLKNVFGAIDRGEGLLGEMLRNREQGAAIIADLERTVGQLAQATTSVASIVKRIEDGEGAIGVLLERGEEIERALVRLDGAAGALQRLARRLEEGEGAIPRLLEDRAYADAVLSDFRAAAADLAAVAEKANHGEGTLGKLVNDPSLYENANDLVTDVRTSWVFSLYRGLRGLFPPYRPPVGDSPAVTDASSEGGPGYQWWSSP